MMQSQFDFVLAAPEIFLLAMSMLILLADAFWGGGRRALAYGLSLATLAVLFILTFLQWTAGVFGETFFGLFVSDPLALVLKLASYIAVAVTLIYGREYIQIRLSQPRRRFAGYPCFEPYRLSIAKPLR